MHPASRFRPMPYRFEKLSALTHNEVVLWNWYIRIGPTGMEWRSWLAEIFGNLLERRAGQQLQLVQTHLVDAEFGEKVLSFGSKPELFIGRAPENDVVLPAKSIASRHARVALNDGALYLEDLGGRLGTYLWEKRMQPNEAVVLRHGDQFSVFPYRFRVLLEQSWSPETDVSLSECRMQPLSRAEFLAMSPAGWRVFVVNPHPSGERALLEASPSFLAELQQRVFGPLGLDRVKDMVPSDDVFVGFVMLAVLERLNRKLRFPVQFSFGRGTGQNLADGTRGILLSSVVGVGGLTGHFRIFLPLQVLSKCEADTVAASEKDFPPGLCWKFPVSAGFVDLLPDEIAQIGLGDILVSETAAATLFPNDFSKGWTMVDEGSNSTSFRIDKYFERSMSLETSSGGTEAASSKPDIGGLPLRLHVIVGEKEFTLAEIQSLSPGTIVELETTKSDSVRLMVNGKILGEGELVDVEGKLAVKVLGWRAGR